MAKRCYCVFEGGGAKGIAHIGALAALQESGLELKGFAGTSAGAIIAALAAVGYSAEELFGESRSVLDEIDLDRSNLWSGEAHRPARKPTRLFGRAGWLAIRIARSLGRMSAIVIVIALLLAAPMLSFIEILSPRASLFAALTILILLFLLLVILAEGLANLKTLEWAINQAISLRLAKSFKLENNHRGRDAGAITFAQLEAAGCPALKIVAADITKRELALFSAGMTPHESVAAAVAASVCLPVIFKPWKIKESLHLDGGLVSNLPAWTFDAERAIDQDAWTAIIEVGAKPGRASGPSGLGILSAAISTGIFGSGQLNVRNVDRLRGVKLPVELDLLQFDLDRNAAAKEIARARARCIEKLVYEIDQLPAHMDGVCQRLAQRARQTVNGALKIHGKPRFRGTLRTAMLVPFGDDKLSLQLEYSSGHENHTDERIRLPLVSSFAGEAMKTGEALYIERRDPEWSSYLARPEDRCTRKLIWPAMHWCLCVPYEHEPTGTKFAIGLDSNRYVALPEDLVLATMGSLSKSFSTMLDQYLPPEAFQKK